MSFNSILFLNLNKQNYNLSTQYQIQFTSRIFRFTEFLTVHLAQLQSSKKFLRLQI